MSLARVYYLIVIYGLAPEIAFSQEKFLELAFERVLATRQMTEVLDLNQLKDRGAVRIFTGDTVNYRVRIWAHGDSSGTPVYGGIVGPAMLDINTGNKRDLLLTGFERKNDSIYFLSIIAAEYLFRGTQKNIYRGEYCLKISDKEAILLEEKVDKISCSSYPSRPTENEPNSIATLAIESLFKLPEVRELLILDSINMTPIRIIDQSKMLLGADIRVYDPAGMPLDCYILQDIPYDFNTGCFRDVFLSRLEVIEGNIISIYLSTTQHLESKGKKIRYYGDVKFTFVSDELKLVAKEFSWWH